MLQAIPDHASKRGLQIEIRCADIVGNVARLRHVAARVERHVFEQGLEQPLPERALARGLAHVGGGDEPRVVDGRERDVADAGRAQLLDGERPVARGAGVAQQGEEALQLARLDPLLDPQQGAVAAIERARERPYLRGLELLAAADEPVAADAQGEWAGHRQIGADAAVRGGHRGGAGGVTRRVRGQIAPGRHE